MTDNERLQSIRDALTATSTGDPVYREVIEFLMKQLDSRDITIAELRIVQQPLYSRRLLEQQNAIMRRELEWFADPDNYVGDHDEDGYHSAPIANGFKRAQRAQRALEGMES